VQIPCTESGQTARVPQVCLRAPFATEDTRLITFWRVIGSLMEWSAGIIADQELCCSLRKAAAEVEDGGA
jgi:hypothetical protein